MKILLRHGPFDGKQLNHVDEAWACVNVASHESGDQAVYKPSSDVSLDGVPIFDYEGD